MRRAERRLATDYATLVDRVIARLTPANHTAAIALVAAAGEIRGFGPVKDEARAAYRQTLPGLEARFEAAADDVDAADDVSPAPIDA
ncbi:DUF6537 domain-containing protein [Sphingomonas oligophenolica]|uniref:DUF6537 domain-containing protein n=1 Tax=Sphingomonas oligophenolica TaxID=301154 RepID=A0ABU9Y967_9SPHN